MRILLLATDAYGGHGGIALFNRELCAALSELPEVTEIVVVPRVIRTLPEGVPPKVRFQLKAARNNLHYARAVTSLLRETFDLVICGHVNLLPVACTFARPLLVVHGIEAWQPLKSAIRRRLIHRCRAVVSVSAVTRDRLLAWSHYRGPVHVLPNAVHLEQYSIRPKRDDLVQRYGLAGKQVLLTVGRLAGEDRSKGFDEVLEVLPQLPEDVVYMIAGGGHDLPRLRDKAQSLGVGERVIFTGLFPESEKPDLYNLADVYVMPSRGEGFGFVFLEALASGLPVIGSKVDGGREALLDGKLGTLVDPDDRNELREAIVTLLDNPRREVPDALAHFSFEKFVERVAAIVRGT
ncbi:MAG TPA: glycosyltransferase family 4 protein [Thermoanaerobaculia bacterium]|nr:glycosyltransferase family 4 protein [Thermoanaerobaculia bacterium]